MEKLLTISIAAYNSEKFIGEAIESILKAKSINKIEILVNDDGGNDNTLVIAEKYAKKYPEIVYPIHKQNGGWGSTVNYAIMKATGKYVKLLDGDDLLDANGIDALVEKISSINADIFYTPLVTFDYKTRKEIQVDRPNIEYNKILPIENVDHRLTMPAMTVKTELLREGNILLTEKCFYTDFEYNVKCIGNATTIYAIDCILYKYRMGHEGQSVSSSGRLRHYEDQFKVLNSIVDFYFSKQHSGKKDILALYICLYLDHTLLAMCELGKEEDCRRIVEAFERKYPGLYKPLRKKAKIMKLMNYRFSKILVKINKEFLG